MHRFMTYATALFVALAGTVAMAQQVTTAEGLEQAMKRISGGMAGANQAIKSISYADARTQVATIRQALVDAENFWKVNNKADAVKMSQDAIGRVTAVEQALSGDAPSGEAVMAAMKQVGGACTACHMAYRVQNEDKTYALRPGAI